MTASSSQAPYPNVFELLTESLERAFQRNTEQGLSRPSLAGLQLDLLQQRTLADHESLDLGKRTESASLVLAHLEGSPHLVVAVAARPFDSAESSGWRMEQVSLKPIAADLSAASQPFELTGVGGVGRYIIGGIVASSEIAAFRLTLAEGTVFEEPVVDGSCLLFAPLRSPEQWAEDATFEILDRGGRAILTEKHWVNPYVLPYERPGVGPIPLE